MIRKLAIAISIVLVAMILYYWLVLEPDSYFSGRGQLVDEMLTGFHSFLRGNLPAIAWNRETWLPGTAAFLMLPFAIHFVMKPWARRRNRYWSFGSSICTAMSIPALFSISLIVPGILVQWDALRQTPWVEF
jgi:hypothetical protein